MRKFLIWQMGPLRDAAGDGGDGGGGGGGGAPAFDPAKFRSEIMADVTKSLNGGLSRIERQLAALKQPPAANGDSGGDGGGDGDGGGEAGWGADCILAACGAWR